MKTVQYYGAGNFNELSTTGRLVLWTYGQAQSVPDDIAAKLIAAGVGFVYDTDQIGGEVAKYATDSSGNVTGLVGPDGGVIALDNFFSGAATFALLGDSRNDQASISAINSLGIGRTSPAYNYFNWANALNARQFDLVAKFAISGSQSSALDGQVTQVAALTLKPKFSIIFCGVNDLAVSVSASTIATNIINAANRLIGYGITPIIFLECGSTSLTQTQLAQLFQLNERLISYADSTTGVIYYDPRNMLWNPTSSATAVVFNAGYSTEGTHTNTIGAYWLGKDFGTFMSKLLPKRERRAMSIAEYNTTSNPLTLLNNGLFTTATGGTATTIGVVGGNATPPAGWTIQGAATSNANMTTVARADGFGNDFQTTITTTGADTIQIKQDAAAGQRGAVNVGEYMQTQGEISVSGTLTNFTGIRVRHEYNDGTTTYTFYDLYIDATTGQIPEGFTAIVEPPKALFSTAPSGWVTTRYDIVTSGAASGLVVKLGRCRTTRKFS